MHTPRSTLASWSGAGGANLVPLYEALRGFVLGAPVLHAEETPVRMLAPGTGKTVKAYVWAYARGEHDGTPGVIYDFCTGRGSKYPADFLAEWTGTLTCDDYSAYDVIFRREGSTEAGCLAHARRKFDELVKANASPVAAQAIVRIARIYRLESQAREMTVEARLAHRQRYTQPLWDELHAWMKQERARVPDGGGIAAALDYSLKRWVALGRFLDDGAVSVGRVEMWRGGRRSGLSVAAPFVWRCPSTLAVAPFPHPPHRTGRADCPHPALFRRIKPSRSSGRVQAAAGVSAPTSRRGTGRSIGGTPFPAGRCAFATRFAIVAPCSHRWTGKSASPALD